MLDFTFDHQQEENLSLYGMLTTRELGSWKKVILKLPRDVGPYRLIFMGEYNSTANWRRRNMVVLDDIELKRCSQGKYIHHLLCSSLAS